MPKVISIDIDGVIADTEGRFKPDNQAQWPDFYRSAPLIKKTIESLFRIKALGFEINLLTARPYTDAKVTMEWLEEHGIPYDSITFDKPLAMFYVDDRAIEFQGWDRFPFERLENEQG